MQTDARGRYLIRTIRPAGYPATDLPAHVHVALRGRADPSLHGGTEIRFDDDPRMTPSWRERSRDEGCVICPVARDVRGVQSVTADFTVR